jgi:hypothetical protein
MRDWQRAVITRLEDLLSPEQVYEEGPPDEDALPMYPNRMVKPYVVVWFGQRVSGGIGYDALCGVRESAHVSMFITQVVAATGEVCNDVSVVVADHLLGFRPADQGELREDSAPTIRQPLDVSGVNSRYQRPIAFSGTVDL